MVARQKLPKIFIRSGSFYIIKRFILKRKFLSRKKCKGLVLKGLETTNIDQKVDLEYLRLNLK